MMQTPRSEMCSATVLQPHARHASTRYEDGPRSAHAGRFNAPAAIPPRPRGYGPWSPEPPPPLPFKPQPTAAKLRPGGDVPTNTTIILVFFVLLCVFSCLLTVTLSYKWHTDTNRQIDRLLESVEDVSRDLGALTDIVRNELAAKRVNDEAERTVMDRVVKAAPEVEYDETPDEDYGDHDRFMGRELDNNNDWPSKRSYGDGRLAAKSTAATESTTVAKSTAVTEKTTAAEGTATAEGTTATESMATAEGAGVEDRRRRRRSVTGSDMPKTAAAEAVTTAGGKAVAEGKTAAEDKPTTEDTIAADRRRQRSAVIDATKTAKNQLNG